MSSVYNLDSIIKPSFCHESSAISHNVTLPDGFVHSNNFPLLSSSLVVMGELKTVLRFRGGNSDKTNLVRTEANPPQSNDVHGLFILQNASLSVQRLLSINPNLVIDHVGLVLTEQYSDSFDTNYQEPEAGVTDGADGVCVSQTNHRSNLSSFESVLVTVAELQILNVSSQPGEMKHASSQFSQRMVGCAIWGSNNHLSGSLLRDLNGGGSFLCSNSTFDWCRTTSSERPSIVSQCSPNTHSHSSSSIRGISSRTERGNADAEYADQTFDTVERLSFTQVSVSFTNCKFTNMEFTATSSSAQHAGGSAIFFASSTKTVSLVSCSFSKCSVTSSFAVYGACVYMFELTTSTNNVQNCTFADWYPSNDTNTEQFGGGIGTFRTTAPIVITDNNFTLSGETNNTINGGFIASYSDGTTQSTTISNCRVIGDAKTTGLVMNFESTSRVTGVLALTDSQIFNTNSDLKITLLEFEWSSGFTHAEITNTSIQYLSASSPTYPHLFVDCQLNQCSLYSDSRMMYLFSSTTFTGTPPVTSRSTISFDSASHTVFHKCAFTDCSSPSTNGLIYSYRLPSLVVDTCSFTRCSGENYTFDIRFTYSFFYFCSFANVSSKDVGVMALLDNYATFFESCRFDLEEETNALDFDVSLATLRSLNDTTMIGCTSNRQMYFGTIWENRTELTAVQIGPIDAEKNEMRVGTWLPESEEDPKQPIQTFTSLSDALGNISTTPPLDTVITLSDGNFTENTLLEVSQIVEIVGSGSNISDIHSTQLTTNGFVSKSAGKLTLQSLRLIPSSTSSVLASTENSGSLIVLNVVVEDISAITTSLFQFAAGSSEIRHSFFKNIKSTKSLVSVSGTSSLSITNTLFLSITRTSLTPTLVATTQCASCIEGKTSGTVKVLYCRFGACTTNGRAGAIDLEKSNEKSAVEMNSCCFDQNSAGEGVANAVRGDDVVLKSFNDSKPISAC
ncbi:hypothetical protein BLNAU_19396 [Blattamonas nauphoetae]|uniref:Uncharacterized protein n=1 Tax=Blattamonas nauphoetae TaxID=2049346 RepID=A0ABQ9X1K2_9EUKA|nr:hypothetical protein BLNAU_19396 [Blattamonas nauphoetae]